MRLKGVLWKPGVNGLGVWGTWGNLGRCYTAAYTTELINMVKLKKTNDEKVIEDLE